MIILVVSDTHRQLDPLRQLLSLYADKIGMAVHLGDHATDLLNMRADFPGLPLHAVMGNCDYSPAGEAEKIISVNGRKILLTHGHPYLVKMSTDRLGYYAQEKEADACLFGHTHQQVLFHIGPIIFMNPGSLCRPHPGDPFGYGLLKISDEGVVTGTLLSMN